MDRNRIAQISGTAGLAGAACWLLEGAVAPPTGQSVPASLLNIAAFLLIATLIYGLRALGAGRGRFGSVTVWLWGFGHVAVAVATVVSMAAGLSDDENPVFAVGGLLQVGAGLLAAVAVARGTVLTGWRRWTPLFWVLYFALVLMPIGFSGTGLLPNLALFGWAIPVGATSVAVLTALRPAPVPVPALAD